MPESGAAWCSPSRISLATHFVLPSRMSMSGSKQRTTGPRRKQPAFYSDRLVAFCGVTPLKDYALQEIDRCARHHGLRRGLKLHFGNSDVELDKPGHVAQMQRVFAAANRHHMGIVVQIRPNIIPGRPWGVCDVEVRICLAAFVLPLRLA